MLSPGQRLRMVRESQRQSLRDVERAVGLHYSYIGALEREHKSFDRVRAEHLVALARHFGVSVDYLLGRVPPETGRVLRLKMARLKPAELQAFRDLDRPGLRLRQIITWMMEEGYPEFAPDRLAAYFRVPADQLRDMLAGRTEIPDTLLARLCEETGIPEGLLKRGEMPPGVDVLRLLLAHPEAEAYIETLHLALREGIPPRSLAHLVRSFIEARAAAVSEGASGLAAATGPGEPKPARTGAG
ncbi:helix-turn-helix domain-containing protein [Caldinitratiruptor microaerophilus]|uniref:HTH cro/C1-type domain-containing protein n=1 Tax=Caldinitratiruptor microaerophilus TaxID=671077 RepID=A0AA35CKD2_9FIRM|nr:helix-turn-helix transcriptional regulator [Caldinitratiruptor microaerophilus]BDG60827.1 hypothetical protein caldi_19170 [Caldinitratiruptor microaerophilus]